MATRVNEFSRVVDSIYEASISPTHWPVAVEGIAHLHESPKANFLTPAVAPCDGGFIFPYGLSPPMLQVWDERYRRDDVWFQAAVRKGLIGSGRVLLNRDMLTREEFEGSKHYQEFLKDIDISDICTAVVFDGSSPSSLTSVLSVFRGHRDDPFTEDNRHLHGLLTSHVSRALGVMFRLRLADLQLASSLAALDRLSAGVILFDVQGSVTFVNRATNVILESSRNDLSLRAEHGTGLGRLRATHAGDDAILKSEIATAVSTRPTQVSHFCHGISLRRSKGASPLLLHMSTLSPKNEFSSRDRVSVAIGFLVDPDSSIRLDRALLARAYEFTPAECKLAQELMAGGSLRQISTRLGLRASTTKTQLKAIFAKTNTHRQADLVKLLSAFSGSI